MGINHLDKQAIESSDRYRNLIRKFMQEKGHPVRFTNGPHDYHEVSIYGWEDHEATRHIRETSCSWTIKSEAKMQGKSYSQFTDTEHTPENNVGININPADCTCGQYQDIHLRYVGSLSSILRRILAIDDGNETLTVDI